MLTNKSRLSGVASIKRVCHVNMSVTVSNQPINTLFFVRKSIILQNTFLSKFDFCALKADVKIYGDIFAY